MGIFGTVKAKVGEAAEKLRKKITLPVGTPAQKIDANRKVALEKQIEYARTMRGMTQHLGWALYVKEQEDALNAANKALQDPSRTKTIEDVRYLQAEVVCLCRELTRVDVAVQRGMDAAEELNRLNEVPEIGDRPLNLPLEPGDEGDENNG